MEETMNDSKSYLTPKQLSKRWQIPIATLRQWRWLKKGPPCQKIEGQNRYRLEAIEAFEERNLRQHTTMDSNSLKKP